MANNRRRPHRPARTPQAHESMMVSKAMDLAEKRLDDGTASAMEVLHFAKLGSSEYEERLRKVRAEVAYLEAKIEKAQAEVRSDELYEAALRAMQIYSGNAEEEVYDDPPELHGS